MMQMLDAGGYPILCDDRRVADESNPRGYLEYAKVRSIERDTSWMTEAEGRAVKVVSPLLSALPPQFEYRILFLRRSLDEVQQSQVAMLRRRSATAPVDEGDLRADFDRHLKHLDAWLPRQANMSVLNCNYADLIQSPREQATAIARFLKAPLRMEAMLAVVDPTLYRQRTP
ncbi:MAG: sulfotransferase domain-containing protein [Planctomycetes bacterium]|nr:sulfotransferase domain-containing protein [Planctomycetota bacterium]